MRKRFIELFVQRYPNMEHKDAGGLYDALAADPGPFVALVIEARDTVWANSLAGTQTKGAGSGGTGASA
jgi:hypothetical protein